MRPLLIWAAACACLLIVAVKALPHPQEEDDENGGGVGGDDENGGDEDGELVGGKHTFINFFVSSFVVNFTKTIFLHFRCK
jgi:hypothetical protein